MRISYSRCSTYQHCPQQYKLQYVDRLPPPRAIELEFGNAVHAALRLMYDPGQVVPPSLEDVLDAFARAWGENLPEAAEEVRQAYFEQGLDLLRRYHAKHSQQGEGRRTIATERFFNLPFDGEHTITGRIDRIDLWDDGRVEVIDYKTNRRMPARTIVERDPQLAIYRMAAATEFPDREVLTTLLYVFHDYEMRMAQSEEFLAEKQEEIREVIAGIQAAEFGPRPGPHCDWCGYQEHCQLYRAPVVPPDLAEVDIAALLREYAELDRQEGQAKERLSVLKQEINDYLDRCQAERVQGGGYVAERRKYQRVTGWDEARLRELLSPIGLWEKVTQVSSSAVRDLLRSRQLPPGQRRELESAATYSETQQLRVRPVASSEDEESEA